MPAGAGTGSFATLHFFPCGKTDGAGPLGGLTLVGNTLYGTTYLGGKFGSGTIFSIHRSGTHYHSLYSFRGFPQDGAGPRAGLTLVGTTLYGTTVTGGSANMGTIFAYDLITRYRLVYSFQGGADGAGPAAKLTYVNGVLYGTTQFGGSTGCFDRGGCGTVFAYNLQTGKESVVHSFAGGATDGSAPLAALTPFNDELVGTTSSGGGGTACFGGAGCGTIFQFMPFPVVYQVLYSFQGNADGADPVDALTAGSGVLYGNTRRGGGIGCGGLGCGTVFSFNPQTRAAPVLFGAFGGTNGFKPDGDLSVAPPKGPSVHRGTAAGPTTGGGDGSGGPQAPGTDVPSGTIYSVDLKTGVETVLHNFSGEPDGSKPNGALVAFDGAYYGETYKGGMNYSGTLFMLRPP
jgi:uncharacterized repeat protein (TIGR03803 family)